MISEHELAARVLIDHACEASDVSTTRLLVLQQAFKSKWYASLSQTRIAQIGAVLLGVEYTPQLQVRVNKELRLLVKESVLRKVKDEHGTTLFEMNIGND